MGITFTTHGDWSNTEVFLRRAKEAQFRQLLDRFGQQGVNALAAATPVESGLTANSWFFKVEGGRGGGTINWYNSNVNGGVNIAIILQYGHGTGTGGYVRGRDYINPAMRPLFDKFADEAWKAVTKL